MSHSLRHDTVRGPLIPRGDEIARLFPYNTGRMIVTQGQASYTDDARRHRRLGRRCHRTGQSNERQNDTDTADTAGRNDEPAARRQASRTTRYVKHRHNDSRMYEMYVIEAAGNIFQDFSCRFSEAVRREAASRQSAAAAPADSRQPPAVRPRCGFRPTGPR